jgi:peptidoglycan hydrolase CwlO-like protein
LSQLRQQLTTSKSSLCALETELDIKQQTIESLEDELLMVEQSMAHTLEEATGDLRNLETEQDKLHSELLMLRKQLEVAQAVANEWDEVAAEARQVIHPFPQIVVIRLLFCLFGFLFLNSVLVL